MIALALVPPNIVEDGIEILLDKQPDYPSVQEFCDYFMDYWIENINTIHIWNHYDNKDPKTNNHLEGFNYKINKYFESKSHIWKFIEKIQDLEAEMTLKHTRLENGTLRDRGRNRIYIELDLKLANLKHDYATKEIDLELYIEKVNECMHDY